MLSAGDASFGLVGTQRVSIGSLARPRIQEPWTGSRPISISGALDRVLDLWNSYALVAV